MCGIIAYTGKQTASTVLLQGLKQLEYRGYDSAGISVLSRGKLRTWKAAGKLEALLHLLPTKISGKSGIGHTRWATHGAPSDLNAHPHSVTVSLPDDQNRSNNPESTVTISLVHNGIIENSEQLLQQLQDQQLQPQSETDSEILALTIASIKSQQSVSLLEACRLALLQVHGTYGIAAMEPDSSDIILARNGSPVIIGIGEGEMFAASDASALSRHTREVTHLEDGELACLTPDGYQVQSLNAQPSIKTAITLDVQSINHQLGDYAHFMHKEILEQPATIARTLSGRLDHRFNTSHLGGLNLDARELLDIKRIKLLGCGSAYYAAQSGADMIESLARIPGDAEPAAEFRYRNPLIERDTLYIVVSQSGETYDTLAAAREIKRKGGKLLGIVNSVGSTIAREVDGGVYMHAGPEVSVASTKAYSSMLVVFALLALQLARIRDLSPQQGAHIVQALEDLPQLIEETLAQEEMIKTVAASYADVSSAFFVGRTSAYPIALEGAQKLKEISYIHAEAYPASELKHGPLALISPTTPTLVVLPDNDLLEKSLSALEEIKARQGPLIALTNSPDKRIPKLADHVLKAPQCHPILHPMVMAIPLQLFAYHCALALGRDVDQPRNLAKSVTVE